MGVSTIPALLFLFFKKTNEKHYLEGHDDGFLGELALELVDGEGDRLAQPDASKLYCMIIVEIRQRAVRATEKEGQRRDIVLDEVGRLWLSIEGHVLAHNQAKLVPARIRVVIELFFGHEKKR